MQTNWENILLVAGSGSNVGKTTFICELLKTHRGEKPIAVKISPHFHTPTEGLKLISETANYQLFEETNHQTKKDSSLFLQSGASRSFFLQANEEHLAEAYLALLPFLEADRPILIESAALHKYVQSGYLLFIYDEENSNTPNTNIIRKVADFMVFSNGSNMTIEANKFIYKKTWIRNR
jgi:hypothetical protein